MAKVRSFVALDVHVSETWAAIIDAGSGELRRRRLSGRSAEIAEFVASLEGLVCAPGLVPRGPSDRVRPISVTLSGWCGY